MQKRKKFKTLILLFKPKLYIKKTYLTVFTKCMSFYLFAYFWKLLWLITQFWRIPFRKNLSAPAIHPWPISVSPVKGHNMLSLPSTCWLRWPAGSQSQFISITNAVHMGPAWYRQFLHVTHLAVNEIQLKHIREPYFCAPVAHSCSVISMADTALTGMCQALCKSRSDTITKAWTGAPELAQRACSDHLKAHTHTHIPL